MQAVKIENILNIYSNLIDLKRAERICEDTKIKITDYSIFILNVYFKNNLPNLAKRKEPNLTLRYPKRFKEGLFDDQNSTKSFQLALWSIEYDNKHLLSRKDARDYHKFAQEYKYLIDSFYLALLEEELGIRLLNGAIYLLLSQNYHLVCVDETSAKYLPTSCFALPPREEFTTESVKLLRAFLKQHGLDQRSLLIKENLAEVIDSLSKALLKDKELFFKKLKESFGVDKEMLTADGSFDLFAYRHARPVGIKVSDLDRSLNYYLSQTTPCFNLHDIMGHLNAREYSQVFASPLKSFVWLSENYPEFVPPIPSPEDYVNLPDSLPPDSDAVLVALTAKLVQNFLNKNYQVKQAFEATSDIMADYLMARISLADPRGRKEKYWSLSKEISIEKLLMILHYNHCEYMTICFELLSITQGFIVNGSTIFKSGATASEKLETLRKIDYLLPYELYYAGGIPLAWAGIKAAKEIYKIGDRKPKVLSVLKRALDIAEYREEYFPTPNGKSPDILQDLKYSVTSTIILPN